MSSSQSQERQPRRQKKQQQVVEESESDSGSEEQQYEPPKRSNRRSRQQNNQMQQRQQQGPMNQMGGGMPGTMGNVANQAMQQQQQPQGGGGGGKSDTLRLRLDLNLDIEITLKAKIHGDLELALLYVLTLFIFCCTYPFTAFLPPGCVVPCMGEGLQTYLQVDGDAPCLLVSLLCFWSYSHREIRSIPNTVQPNLSSYHHHTVTTSVLYLKNGQGHNVKSSKVHRGRLLKGEKHSET